MGFILLIRTLDGEIHEYPCRLMEWSPESMGALYWHWDNCENRPVPITALSLDGSVLYTWQEQTPDIQLAVAALKAKLKGLS